MQRDYAAAVDAFETELTREQYENGSGLKATLDTQPLYERYAWLFELPRVLDMVAARGEDRPQRLLAEFAALGYLGERVKGWTDRITNAVTQATVDWEGRAVPYRYAPVIIANEPDADRRHRLEREVVRQTAKINPQRLERMQVLHEGADHLGFPSYVALCDELRDLQLKTLTQQMRLLLERTTTRYFVDLEYYLHRVGLDPREATPADITYLARAPSLDEFFPKSDLIPSLLKTLTGLGINLSAQRNVELDVAERPLKSPRAFCAGIRIPEEVKLVIMPKGGHDDYRALLHEAGHTEHFAHTSPDLPVAYRRLGDNSVTEGYAFLFDNLLQNPVWLRQVRGVTPPPDYLRLSLFLKRRMLRRYAAKLLYEQELHVAREVVDMRDRYADLLRQTLGYGIFHDDYLADVDDHFYAAQYLRAWIFEVQLRSYLEKEFGDDWLTRRPAGSFLRDMWHHGQQYGADELARQLGYAGLDPEPLIRELE